MDAKELREQYPDAVHEIEQQAIEAMNRRHEKTCTIEGSSRVDHNIIEWVLSCGHRSLQYIGGAKYWPNYCDECGAKVADDD